MQLKCIFVWCNPMHFLMQSNLEYFSNFHTKESVSLYYATIFYSSFNTQCPLTRFKSLSLFNLLFTGPPIHFTIIHFNLNITQFIHGMKWCLLLKMNRMTHRLSKTAVNAHFFYFTFKAKFEIFFFSLSNVHQHINENKKIKET